MRNLKRVLSLTLASVMLFGMMVMGTSAAKGYDDVDTKDNVEAIEVLQAIGVMTGDANADGTPAGTFRPDEPVKRSEMARIMAALLDLDYAYYTGAGIRPFTDMYGHWAEGYVAACYANGIIAGRTTTTYDPEAYVTAVEASAMMMRALGYFQYASDYARGFETATVAQGTRINIYDGVGSNASEPMTRNQVAQLALNTLKADLVEANDNTLHITTGENAGNINITGGQVTYVVRTSSSSASSDYSMAIGKDTTTLGNASDGRRGGIIQLGEQLYKGDLKLNDSDTDVFGRPAHTWEYKTEIIGTYAIEATAEYTSGVKGGTLYTLIGRTNYNRLVNDPANNGLFVTVNGYELGQITGQANINNYIQNNSNSNATDTGNGVLTQVYVRDDDSAYSLRVDIAITNLWAAKVSSDYNANKGSLSIDVLHTADPSTNVKVPNVGELLDVQFDGLDQYKEGDYILFTFSDPTHSGAGSVETIAPATLVTGTVTRYDFAGDNVTVGGTRYNYNKSLVAADKPGSYGLGKNATVVLDGYDNIIWVDDATGAEDYLYVYGLISNTGFANQGMARVVLPDGTIDEIVVEKLYVRYKNHTEDVANQPVAFDFTAAYSGGTGYVRPNRFVEVGNNSGSTDKIYEILLDSLPGTPGDTTNNYVGLNVRYDTTGGYQPDQFNGWYSYSVDNGKYTLIQAQTDIYLEAGDVSGGGTTGRLKGEAVEFAGTGAGQYANNSTTFILVQGNDVTVYNGINNLPDIDMTSAGFLGSVRANDGRNGTVYAGLVAIIDENAVVSGGTESMLYIIRQDDIYVEKTGETIYQYIAVLNGEQVTIQTKGNTQFNAGQMYDKYMVDADGYYKNPGSATWSTTNTKHVWDDTTINGLTNPNGGDMITTKGDSLVINNAYYLVTKDTKITLILSNGAQATSDTDNALLNRGVKFDVRPNVSASTLAGMDNGYSPISIKWWGTVTSNGGRVLDQLYVVIYAATKT